LRQLNLGGRISINLASNPTTGYMWRLKTPSDLLEVRDGRNQMLNYKVVQSSIEILIFDLGLSEDREQIRRR
jgi:predicted secreted protein